MSVPMNLGQRLVDLGLVDLTPDGPTGWQLFDNGYMPPKPDKVIVLTEYAGGMPGLRTQVDLPGLHVDGRGDPITVPGATEALRTKMKAIRAALHSPQTLTFPDGSLYEEVRAVQSPFIKGTDDNRRSLASCNFLVMEVRQ